MSDTEQQERPKSIELPERPEEELKREPELKLQDIVQEADPQQRLPPEVEQRASQISPPPLKNVIFYYNGHTKYNWRLSEVEPTAIAEQLQAQPYAFTEELPFAEGIEVEITDTPVTAGGVNKHIGYTARRKDRNGEGAFTRRYTEYMSLRKKLSELWPGVFLPILPSKTLLGASEQQVIRSRIKYIHHFWRKVSFYERIYYSEEVALFMDDNVNVEATFSSIQQPKVAELLEKYKSAFPHAYQYCHREEFMYKKDQAPLIFQEFQTYFGKKKVELVGFKDAFMRLADLKTKYFRAVSKLNQSILPSYENVLFRWFNGAPIEDKEPSIMERLSRKSLQRKSQETSASKPAEGEKEMNEQPLPVVLEPNTNQVPNNSVPNSNPKQQHFPNPLYNSEAYRSKLEDTAQQVQEYNSSVWVLYDVLKFELKDIDTVLSALEQVRYVQKDIDYLKRGIAVNKEQLDSLSNRKTTLKTFFMGGSEDDKKNKLIAESQAFQERLQKETELYHILLALVEEQLMKYHQERVEYYTKAVKKAISDELGIARSVTDFHIFEYQLFGKERIRKVQELYPPQAPKEEEIKQ